MALIIYLLAAGNDNLVQAFVQFLEQESQPQSTAQARPNLLSMAKQAEATEAVGDGGADVAAAAAATAAQTATAIATPTTSIEHATPPITVLPPMQSLLMSSSEFAPSRNSSSILKDILSDT